MKAVSLHLIHWSRLRGKCDLSLVKRPGDLLLTKSPSVPEEDRQFLPGRLELWLVALDGLTLLADVQMNLANSLITRSDTMWT